MWFTAFVTSLSDYSYYRYKVQERGCGWMVVQQRNNHCSGGWCLRRRDATADVVSGAEAPAALERTHPHSLARSCSSRTSIHLSLSVPASPSLPSSPASPLRCSKDASFSPLSPRPFLVTQSLPNMMSWWSSSANTALDEQIEKATSSSLYGRLMLQW